jgi:hypothetical protein
MCPRDRHGEDKWFAGAKRLAGGKSALHLRCVEVVGRRELDGALSVRVGKVADAVSSHAVGVLDGGDVLPRQLRRRRGVEMEVASAAVVVRGLELRRVFGDLVSGFFLLMDPQL